MMTDRATEIAEAAAVIRDLLESRGLLDARLEVYAALEGASVDDAESFGEDGKRGTGKWRTCAPTWAETLQTPGSEVEVFPGRVDIPERTLRLTAALAWRILEREAGRCRT